MSVGKEIQGGLTVRSDNLTKMVLGIVNAGMLRKKEEKQNRILVEYEGIKGEPLCEGVASVSVEMAMQDQDATVDDLFRFKTSVLEWRAGIRTAQESIQKAKKGAVAVGIAMQVLTGALYLSLVLAGESTALEHARIWEECVALPLTVLSSGICANEIFTNRRKLQELQEEGAGALVNRFLNPLDRKQLT